MFFNKSNKAAKSAPFKLQLTVCCPKLRGAVGFAKQTVHYFCHLVKGAAKSLQKKAESEPSGSNWQNEDNTDDIIDPKQLIEKLSVEELCATAEQYFQKIPDPYALMAKPFVNFVETPQLLVNFGLVLSGLKLGKTMRVLDFAAGSCWISRYLNQLQCSTVSVDCSTTALEIGKRLFREHPIIGEFIAPPEFVLFNGHTIEVSDASIDRIICFDALHHVPNQEEVLAEFFRVLKPGGIAGFSEPGPNHSRSPQSQYEMRNYTVLENDIHLEEIKLLADKVGFHYLYVKIPNMSHLDLMYEDYLTFARNAVPPYVNDALIGAVQNSNIFFLVKGEYVPDSRTHSGLLHDMDIYQTSYSGKVNEPVVVKVQIKNSGNARWLQNSIKEIGTVKFGAHLYDDNKELVNLDYFRSVLQHDVNPGEEIEKTISLLFEKPGKYFVGFDMVSEFVCWFETVGSKIKFIEIDVQ